MGIFALLGFLLFIHSASANPRFRRLINGTDATHLEYPYMANIISVENLGFCGGALYSADTILTTALCCALLGHPRSWIAFAGSDSLWNGTVPFPHGGQAILVNSARIHPQVMVDE